MEIKNRTALITGGGSGIGLEIARLLLSKGCRVIITGRDAGKLTAAAAALPGLDHQVCDLTSADEVKELTTMLTLNYPSLDLVINNAGTATAYSLGPNAGAFEKASAEIMTNYLAAVRLNEELLPLLGRQRSAAIVHVTSVTAFVPSARLATYGASKAALHSYIQSLRYMLAKTSAIRVFEIMPALVNTAFSQGVGGENGVSPAFIAGALLEGIQEDMYEIRPGKTAGFYRTFLSSPETAFQLINPD